METHFILIDFMVFEGIFFGFGFSELHSFMLEVTQLIDGEVLLEFFISGNLHVKCTSGKMCLF